MSSLTFLVWIVVKDKEKMWTNHRVRIRLKNSENGFVGRSTDQMPDLQIGAVHMVDRTAYVTVTRTDLETDGY